LRENSEHYANHSDAHCNGVLDHPSATFLLG
jgi:hypothetical protein